MTTSVGKAGDYFWVATYSGDPDTGTLGVAGDCGDEGETSVVVPARPGIVTVVPDFSVPLTGAPTELTDTATLTGASAQATGTITFSLYGPFAADPGPDDCTTAKLVGTVDSVQPFTGNGTYTSKPVTVDPGRLLHLAGHLHLGRRQQRGRHPPCGQADETVEVTKARPDHDRRATGRGQPVLAPDESDGQGDAQRRHRECHGQRELLAVRSVHNDPGADSCDLDKLVQTVGSVGPSVATGRTRPCRSS